MTEQQPQCIMHPEHHGEDNTMTAAAGAHIQTTRVELAERAIAIIALIIACVSLGAVLMLPAQQAARVAMLADQARDTERTLEMLREDLRVQAIALAAHGISTDEHSVQKSIKEKHFEPSKNHYQQGR